jgi:hypothetical protein
MSEEVNMANLFSEEDKKIIRNVLEKQKDKENEMKHFNETHADETAETELIPVLIHAAQMAEEKEFSIWRGVVIQWDEDMDTRVLRFVDAMEDSDRENLLSCYEHEGGLTLLWKEGVPQKYLKTQSIEVMGDVWGICESYTAAARKSITYSISHLL